MDNNSKNLSLTFNAKIQPVEKLNEQFVKCKCYVHAIGKNRNLSYFSKENVLRNIDSLNYIPVVGHLMETDDGKRYMGGHDTEIVINDTGVHFKQLTVPFGVVMNNTWDFEDVVEEDGTTATYITADVVLWIGRYPELADAIYDENTYFSESMEINYTNCQPLKEDKNYTDVIDWVYSALCLLGKSDNPEHNVTPCFPSSKIEPYSSNFSQSDFTKVMGEMKEQLAFYFNKDNDKEGGSKNLSEELKTLILQEFSLTLDDIDFEIADDMSEEDFRAKLEEFTNSKKEPETDNQNTETHLFSATYRQKRDALSNALDGNIIRDENGIITEETSYWVEDFDDTFVYVEKDHWTANDYESTYGRFTYTFNETDLTATISSDFEEMVKVWLTVEENQKIQDERNAFELMKSEFNQYKEEHSILDSDYSDYTELKQFKEDTLSSKRDSDEKELFNKFEEDLSSMDEYSNLKEKAKEYSIEQLNEKLYALLGKKNATFSVNKKQNNTKIPVGAFSDEEDPYGGLLSKYYEK
jgi:hypothetical protein